MVGWRIPNDPLIYPISCFPLLICRLSILISKDKSNLFCFLPTDYEITQKVLRVILDAENSKRLRFESGFPRSVDEVVYHAG